jgi:hypothetical protein
MLLIYSYFTFLDSVKAILVHCAHRLLSKLARILRKRRIIFCRPPSSLGLVMLRIGWSLLCKNCPMQSSVGVGGYVSVLDSEGRTIWIADAHRDGKRFVVRAEEMLTAFMELETAIRAV